MTTTDKRPASSTSSSCCAMEAASILTNTTKKKMKIRPLPICRNFDAVVAVAADVVVATRRGWSCCSDGCCPGFEVRPRLEEVQ